MTETTIRKLIPEFLADLETKKRSPSTVIAYRADLQQLEKYLETKNIASIAQIASGDLATFRDWLLEKKYTPKSASRKLNALKTFFRWAISANHLTSDPSKDVSHPKIDPSKPKFLSPLEYRALRDACRGDIRMYAIVELFLQTGIRIGELATLTVTDVKDGELHIASQEGHAQRGVPLNKAAKEALDRYMAIRSTSQAGSDISKALFITKTGRPLLIRNIRTAIDRYFRIAGIEGAKVNDLRHTFIAHHLMAGTPITTLSKLVGHKRLSTTERYLELIKDKAGESVKLEEL